MTKCPSVLAKLEGNYEVDDAGAQDNDEGVFGMVPPAAPKEARKEVLGRLWGYRGILVRA